MSEIFGMRMSKKEMLKTLIKKIHEGEDPEVLKKQFKEIFGSVSSTEIAEIEQELIKEGMPREEVMRLCEVHFICFSRGVRKGEQESRKGASNLYSYGRA